MSAVGGAINPYRLFTGAFIPSWLLGRPEVSQGAKLTYAVLARHAHPDTGEASPTAADLAEALGVDERQARRYTAELVEVGLVESRQRGLGRPNLYRFLAHPWTGLAAEASEGMGEGSPADTGVRQDRTHMSGQDLTHVSVPDLTHVSVPSSFGSTIRETEERENLSAPLTGHAGLLFADLTVALPDVPAWELRRWVREHADLPIETAQALAAAARGRPVKSTRWLDTTLERGIAQPSAPAASPGMRGPYVPLPDRPVNPYDAVARRGLDDTDTDAAREGIRERRARGAEVAA